MKPRAGDFDVRGLLDAVDAERERQGLSWRDLARLWAWVSPQALNRLQVQRGAGRASCQAVLPLIQWLGRTPESFTDAPPGAPAALLPDPGAEGWRWYWDTRDLGASVASTRQERGLTWKQVAAELGCPVASARGLTRPGRTRPGFSGQGIVYHPIGLAMRAARFVGRPAASFMWEIPEEARRAAQVRSTHLRRAAAWRERGRAES